MESLILLTKNNVKNMEVYIDAIKFANILPRLIDTTKCTDMSKPILSICNFSKITDEEYLDLFKRYQNDINILDCVFDSGAELSQEFQKIEFNKFTESQQQLMLIKMLQRNVSVDILSLLLNKMNSVNYGSYSVDNPLLFCCARNKLDCVKLLVEKYGANIEHENPEGETAIMYAVDENHLEVVKYLYYKGAKTSTSRYRIDDYSIYIRKTIQEWDIAIESQKQSDDMMELKHKLKESETKNNQLQSDYDMLHQKWIKLSQFIINSK